MSKTQTVRCVTSAPKVPRPQHLPAPAKNLGAHLKTPRSGEIVTEHHKRRPK